METLNQKGSTERRGDLQSRQPDIRVYGEYEDGAAIVRLTRSEREIIDSSYDDETSSGTIRFKVPDGRIYTEVWDKGKRVRLSLEDESR